MHKHSLLHHVCHTVLESFPDTTDLYSEIGTITRASKTDFNELSQNIKYLETECKASWERLKLISKHDTSPQLKQKLIDFLADCAERIIILDVVHRRVINRFLICKISKVKLFIFENNYCRYQKFLQWLGVPSHKTEDLRPDEICRMISEFALEYRTTRERVHQQIENKVNQRERSKARSKLVYDAKTINDDNFSHHTACNKEENSKDAQLR